MKNSTTFLFKPFILVIFCSLFFLRSNAQHKGERHQQSDRGVRNQSQSINRDSHLQHSPVRVNGESVRSQPNSRIRENHVQPAIHNSPAPAVHPATNARPPAHPFLHPDKTYREQARVAPRPGYQFYNNGYRYHYTNRPPVYNPRNPSWRYGYLPPRRTVITSFPFQYQTINYGGYGYRFYNGTFYRPYNSAFMVVAPPIGLFINVLPFGYRRIYVNENPYYYYNGTYYDEYENNYRVVAPPVGAVVESIPQGYETATIDGETYYKVDGVQYKPVVQDNGEIWYQVIKVD